MREEYYQVLEYVSKDELETFSNFVVENFDLKKGHVLAIAKHIANAVIQVEPQEPLPSVDYDITGDLTASASALVNDLKTDMKNIQPIVTFNKPVSRILMADARHSRVETANNAWAYHNELGCQETLETLQGIAHELNCLGYHDLSSGGPEVMPLKLKYVTKHRHLYLHLMMVMDNSAKMKNAEPSVEAMTALPDHFETIGSQSRQKIDWSRKCSQRSWNAPEFLAMCFYPHQHVPPPSIPILGAYPTPSFQHIHITLDGKVLYPILGTSGLANQYSRQEYIDETVKHPYFVNQSSLRDQETHTSKQLFTGIMATGGYAMTDELPYLQPWGLDPGECDIFVVVDDAAVFMYELPTDDGRELRHASWEDPALDVPRTTFKHGIEEIDVIETRTASKGEISDILRVRHPMCTALESKARRGG
ncbi:hypothetical protein DM01DRAFT_1377430 [Hesseltinella vesiculosa]|uniref:Uncharacterized protein n=1 Tax=Hesseltinella vesiculosa TaxID=101127 RepID=A0A1X2G7G3_9FUNG|nr:hypothetical protein DM01DRAFT_1377430 [Hesseltinella vesiculosa]